MSTTTNTDIAANLNTLATFPEALQRQVQVLPDATLRFKPEGEWSAIENVGHLVDVEHIWMGRFRQMLAAENPTFPRPDVDEMVRQHDYQHKDLANLLRTFRELRAETVAFLGGLKPMHLERPGVHPLRGPITVASGIGIMVGHDRLHTEQIAKTVEGVNM